MASSQLVSLDAMAAVPASVVPMTVSGVFAQIVRRRLADAVFGVGTPEVRPEAAEQRTERLRAFAAARTPEADAPQAEAHVDAPHAEAHADAPQAEAHADAPHAAAHADAPHADAHADAPHAEAHADAPHAEAHADAPHAEDGSPKA